MGADVSLRRGVVSMTLILIQESTGKRDHEGFEFRCETSSWESCRTEYCSLLKYYRNGLHECVPCSSRDVLRTLGSFVCKVADKITNQ